MFFLALFVVIIPPGGFSAWSFESGVRWFYLFSVSFLVYHIIHPYLIKVAYRYDIFDFPNSRKIHNLPVARIGGVGIFISFLFTVLRNFQFPRELIFILISSFIIFITGFIDDIKGISAFKRLFFQFIASLVVVAGGVSIKFPLSWGIYGILVSYLVSILWILLMVNTFNFIDGIDGLAGSLCVVICFIFLIIVINTSQYQVMFITAAICGAVVAFLFYNWNPASIFMGDAGSTLIGFLMAVLSIYVSWADNNPFVSFSAPVMVLFIPIFDLIYTTLSRIKNGLIKNLYDWIVYAGKDHIHHRIVALGFSVKETVFIISLLNLICGLAAVNMVIDIKSVELFISFLQMICVFTVASFFMRRGRESA